MKINHPTCTQKEYEDTCGKAEGCTDPLAGFQRCSPRAFMSALTIHKRTQIWLPGPLWSSAQREGGREQHCVSIAKYCIGITTTCVLTHVRLVWSQWPFLLRSWLGWLYFWWHIDGDKNQKLIMLSKGLKIVQRARPTSPLTSLGNGVSEPDKF